LSSVSPARKLNRNLDQGTSWGTRSRPQQSGNPQRQDYFAKAMNPAPSVPSADTRPGPRHPSDHKLGLLLLLAGLGAVLRLPNLGESLWFDEVMYSTKYLMASWSDLWRLFLFDPPAPLYRVFMFFWTTLFGGHELVLRLPSLLFGISSILLAYLIAETSGSRKAALLAALLLCLSPVQIWYSQEGTPYSMAQFFLLATVYLYRRIMAVGSDRRRSVLYLVFFLLSVFTHYYAAIFILPLSISALPAESRTRRRILAVHLLVVLCLVVFLGIKYAAGHMRTGMDFLRPFTWFEWWMLFFNWFLQGNSLWTVNPYAAPRLGFQYLLGRPLLAAVQLLSLVVLCRGLMLHSKRTGWAGSRELLLLLFTPPAVMLALTQIGLRHLYIERYLYLVLPFFFIVLARSASGFSRRSPRVAATLFLAILGVASCGAFFYKNDSWTVYKQNPDWRSAASYLVQKNTAPGDELVVLSVTPADALKYYLRRQGLESFQALEVNPTGPFPPLLPGNGSNKFYLIKNRYWRGDFDQAFLKIKENPRMRLVSSPAFKGLDVYFFISNYPSNNG